jgi:DNA-binding GntR family transcriptional regulator
MCRQATKYEDWRKRIVDVYSLEKSLPYYEQIYHSIKQMIFQGVFAPGDRIYEAKIAREFNVSRSPVREAVRALEKDGLLFIDGKSQITVYKPTMRDVEEIYQCRMALESLAAELTTRLASSHELEEIEKTLIQTKDGLEHKDDQNKDILVSLNGRFHDLITRFSRNKRLQKQLDDLRSLTYYYRVINFQGDNRAGVIFNEHQKIFTYIKQRNEQKASSVMAEHITNDLNHLKGILNGL